MALDKIIYFSKKQQNIISAYKDRRYFDFHELPFYECSLSNKHLNIQSSLSLFSLSPQLSRQVCDPNLVTMGGWNTVPLSHCQTLLSLSLSGPDSLWQYGGGHTQSQTQTHILWVLVTCSQKMSLSTSRETDRGWAVVLLQGGLWVGGKRKRGCWVLTCDFLNRLSLYFSAVSEGEASGEG